MAAPTVQALQDLITQYTTAQAPQQQAIDENINTNEQSGQGQVAGLNAAKNQAFGQIEQNASNKGLYFSGFSPNQQATYTGSTYLPALAKLQSVIAGTRDTLLGKKADLQTSANNSALGTQQDEQKQLDAYNAEQEKEAQARAAALQQQQFEASENAKNRSASASAASSKAPSAGDIKTQTSSAIGQNLAAVRGHDGYVSPGSYAAGKADWIQAGYSSKEYDQIFAGLRNPANKNYTVNK